jgi:DNA-binding response OmpR family regulator
MARRRVPIMGASMCRRDTSETLENRKPNRQRPRIVVAEDDPEMRDLVASALHKDGYEVTAVEDGARLLVWVVSRRADLPADLIISDLRMPISSGLQILRGLREAGWTIPFILLTAFGDEQTRAEAESLGAIFFDKPFELGQLRTAVGSLFPSDRHA